MPGRAAILALAALAVVLIQPPAAWAQKRAPRTSRVESPDKPSSAAQTPIDVFETMSPAEQQQALQNLPPAQRRMLQQRLDKFNQLPADQQRTLRNLYNRLHHLPTDRQNAVRSAINKFSRQPADRQAAIRQELRNLADASVEDRTARMASREFRKSFSSQERDIIRDMSPLLPPR